MGRIAFAEVRIVNDFGLHCCSTPDNLAGAYRSATVAFPPRFPMRLHLPCCTLVVLASLSTPAVAGDGFESLFNGKDLTGWKYYAETDLTGKTATADGRFTVKDGVIIAEVGKGIKDLYTAKAYNGNFHFKVEFRAALKADSGVYVRGPQLQVRDFPRRGEMKQLTKFKNDDWNELDIVVTANKLLTKVNGKSLAPTDALEVSVKSGTATARVNGKEIDLSKLEVVHTAIAHCTCNGQFMEDMAVPNASEKGIGLQAETGKFEFRNVRIKMLP